MFTQSVVVCPRRHLVAFGVVLPCLDVARFPRGIAILDFVLTLSARNDAFARDLLSLQKKWLAMANFFSKRGKKQLTGAKIRDRITLGKRGKALFQRTRVRIAEPKAQNMRIFFGRMVRNNELYA